MPPHVPHETRARVCLGGRCGLASNLLVVILGSLSFQFVAISCSLGPWMDPVGSQRGKKTKQAVRALRCVLSSSSERDSGGVGGMIAWVNANLLTGGKSMGSEARNNESTGYQRQSGRGRIAASGHREHLGPRHGNIDNARYG